jgi:small nuclear ribonucleoprotein G
MSGGKGPDLKRYMERRMSVKLVANRRVTGTLRGYDQFMNLVLDDATEDVSSTEQHDIGMVVVRGNSVIEFELLEKEVQIDRCTGQVVG